MKNIFVKKLLLLSILALSALLSCKKIAQDDKIITKNNLALLPNGNSTTVDIYYNLTNKTSVSSSNNWDLKINWLADQQINANTSYNTAKGAINFIDKPFNEVSVGDIFKHFAGQNGSQSDFINKFTNLENFGLDTDKQKGWLVKDKDDIYLPVKDRTLILITPINKNSTRRKLYIIEIKSIYKDLPSNPTKGDIEGYLSFRYKEMDTSGIITL